MSSSLVEERQLDVYINDKPVGQLKERNGLWYRQPGCKRPAGISLCYSQQVHAVKT
jgi:serine/threonine-protein kinase HipA